MKFSVEVVAKGATLEQVRALYFSPAFDDALAKAANLVSRKQRQHVVEPDGRERTRTRVVPNVGLPSTFQALLRGNTISYDEVVVYDPKTQRATFTIRSLAGKTVQVNGEIAFVQDSGDVRVEFHGEARIHVFGIGGALERFLVHEVTTRFAKVQGVLQEMVGAPR